MGNKAEREYQRALNKIARHVSDIVRGYPPGDPSAATAIRVALDGYASIIDGWARMTAGKFVASVVRLDETSWRERSQRMSKELRRELFAAPTGDLMRRLQEDQVALIKSIPINEGLRVHQLTLAGLSNGTRANETAAEIMRSNTVTLNRAKLIARTETSRASTALVEARARYVGSDGYIWRTSRDGAVREEHRDVNGKYFTWATPPTFPDGHSYHPGCFPNCRCWADPVLPE